MNLEDPRVRRPVLLAYGRAGWITSGGPEVLERDLDSWEERSPEGRIPRATRLEMPGRLEGEQGVKRGWNSEDATCLGVGPWAIGSFELAIAVGNENPMRGTALTRQKSGYADARNAGVSSGEHPEEE